MKWVPGAHCDTKTPGWAYDKVSGGPASCSEVCCASGLSMPCSLCFPEASSDGSYCLGNQWLGGRGVALSGAGGLHHGANPAGSFTAHPLLPAWRVCIALGANLTSDSASKDPAPSRGSSEGERGSAALLFPAVLWVWRLWLWLSWYFSVLLGN